MRSNRALRGTGIALTVTGAVLLAGLCSDEYGWLCIFGGPLGGTALFAGVPMLTVGDLRHRAVDMAPELHGFADISRVGDPDDPLGRRYTRHLWRAGWASFGVGLGLIAFGTTAALTRGPNPAPPFVPYGVIMQSWLHGSVATVTGSALLGAAAGRKGRTHRLALIPGGVAF